MTVRIEACEENARENATTKNVVESILLGGDEEIGSERQLIVLLLLSRLFFFPCSLLGSRAPEVGRVL